MKKRKEIIVLAVLLLALFVLNYSSLDKITGNFLNENRNVHIDRVIDGDTVVAENETIRLLGINTPERGEILYDEAKKFLNDSIFNKSVFLEENGLDRYKRTLAYLNFNGENVNLKLVEEGFANPYFPKGKEKYYDKFFEAWNKCMNENKNLCEKSTNNCSSCIALKDWDTKNEELILYNKCTFSCELTNWSIKDEGRKKFTFPNFVLESNKEVNIIVGKGNNNNGTLFWTGQTYVWTQTGDSIFLRDEKGKLILWENY